MRENKRRESVESRWEDDEEEGISIGILGRYEGFWVQVDGQGMRHEARGERKERTWMRRKGYEATNEDD